MEGKYCKYMNKVCTRACKYAYELKYDLDGIACLRPDTKAESIVREIQFYKSRMEYLLKQLIEDTQKDGDNNNS